MSAAEVNKGRVKIDLGEFFTDYRRQSYILLKSKWSTVKDLTEYIEKTFEIKDIVVMTADEVYLPLLETIDIVSPDDELKIVTKFHIPSTPPPKIKQKSAVSCSGGGESIIPTRPKRKRAHKRKLANAEKILQTTITKVPPPKVLKTDIGTNVSHVYFDEECNAKSVTPKVKFINYIDTLDATKARVIAARGIKSCAKEVAEIEKKDEVNKKLINITAGVEVAAA